MLHNRASELPDNHPVAKLTNCIIFGTDGNRPDAGKLLHCKLNLTSNFSGSFIACRLSFIDKMGGGDLDGDRFLIVWDYRLIKYSNKIQAYEAQDYDVDSSGNERKRAMVVYSDDQTNNSDWIHAAAMLDSVMLGAIENSYYALAKVRTDAELQSRLNHHTSHAFLYQLKEFGVISAEINELNQLFSQLVCLDMISLSLSRKNTSQQHLV